MSAPAISVTHITFCGTSSISQTVFLKITYEFDKKKKHLSSDRARWQMGRDDSTSSLDREKHAFSYISNSYVILKNTFPSPQQMDAYGTSQVVTLFKRNRSCTSKHTHELMKVTLNKVTDVVLKPRKLKSCTSCGCTGTLKLTRQYEVTYYGEEIFLL